MAGGKSQVVIMRRPLQVCYVKIRRPFQPGWDILFALLDSRDVLCLFSSSAGAKIWSNGAFRLTGRCLIVTESKMEKVRNTASSSAISLLSLILLATHPVAMTPFSYLQTIFLLVGSESNCIQIWLKLNHGSEWTLDESNCSADIQ